MAIVATHQTQSRLRETRWWQRWPAWIGYALFGTLLVSSAVGLRRPHEAFIGYATLTCWCVLLLLLPVLHPDDVSGGGAWYAGMIALLALGVYGVLRGALGFAARA